VWNYWWISTILLNSNRSRSESAVYWNFKRKCDDLVILSIEQSYGFECNKDLSVVDTMKNYIARVHITMDFLPLSGASMYLFHCPAAGPGFLPPTKTNGHSLPGAAQTHGRTLDKTVKTQVLLLSRQSVTFLHVRLYFIPLYLISIITSNNIVSYWRHGTHNTCTVICW